MTIAKITKAYTRRYSDTNQATSYVEWVDTVGMTGRTEGPATSIHMRALLERAFREGVFVDRAVMHVPNNTESLSAYVTLDDVSLPRREFLRLVADRIVGDLT